MKKFIILLVLCLFIGCGGVSDYNSSHGLNDNDMGEPKIYRIDRFTGGLNLKQDPNIITGGIQPEQAIECQNCDFRDGVSIQTRDGYAKLIDNTYAKNVVGLYPFYVVSTRHMMVLTWDGSAFALFDSTTSKDTGTASAIYFNPSVYNDLMYIPHAGNSDSENYNLKYDGTTITKCGIDPPLNTCSGVAVDAVPNIYCSRQAGGDLKKFNDTTDLFEAISQSLPYEASTTNIAVLSDRIYIAASNGRLYRWDNSSYWEEVAPTLDTSEGICSLCVYSGKLYGGTLSHAYLYEWDGTAAWVKKATQPGTQTQITCMCVYGGKLYGSTYPSGKLVEWNDSDAWVEKAPQLSSQTKMMEMVSFDDGGGADLYGASYPGGYLFRWNGTNAWGAVTSIASYYFYSLCSHNNGSTTRLYASQSTTGKLFEWNNTNAWAEKAPQLGTEIPTGLLSSGGYLYGCTIPTGHLYRWNNSSAWQLQTAAGPGVSLRQITVATIVSGLTSDYQYFYTYVNSLTGQESALSPISSVISVLNQGVNLSNLEASTDTQVDKKRIYRTGGTLTTINFIAEIDNATTTYQDNFSDTSVGDIEDCSNNDVLPAVRFFSMHHHQLFAGYSDADKGYVFDSRFYQPESFPDTYFFRVGNDSDPVIAVMALDIDMIVYTALHTFRLRYIGTSEGDVVLEEIAAVGLASDNTLVTAIDPNRKALPSLHWSIINGQGYLSP